MEKLSIIIPTIQRNKTILANLVAKLDADEAVSEIILINNCEKEPEIKSKKLKHVFINQNIFVNAAWNLGFKLAKCDYIGLMNDDIIIPDNFCKMVAQFLSEKIGIIGMDINSVKNIENENEFVSKINNLAIVPARIRDYNFGVAMFLHKNSYFEIPKCFKIWYGDDWLFLKNQKLNRPNFNLRGLTISHVASNSVKDVSFSNILKNDKKIFKILKLTI